MRNYQRDSFTSKTGFILASVGAAVGMGNLWMFPWRVGSFGGAAFLIPYLLFVYILGTTGLMGEIGFGRWARKGPIGAYDKVLQMRGLRFGRYLGAYPVLATWGVLLFYAIVAGWIIRYLVSAINGSCFRSESVQGYFYQFAGRPISILWQLLAIFLCGGVIAFGIAKGIERATKIMMPVLIIIFFILMVRSLTLPGSVEGIKYILIPDWTHLLKPITWGMALGQAFFSVTLTGAGMLVYGSYLSKKSNVPHAAFSIVSLDTVIALVAALVIMPATFAYGLDPASGPPLLFITSLEVFTHMPEGRVIAILFFLGVLFAAVTSIFIMMETIVEAMMDRFQVRRKQSMFWVVTVTFLAGIPLAINMAWFEKAVDIITVYLVPLGAVMAGFLFFWVFSVKKARAEINIGARKPVGEWWEPVAKYIFVGISFAIIFLQIVFRIGG